jgi:Protein of unknown function (DUF3667)
MTISCKNCDHKYKGNFCHNCGQKAATHAIDFKFVVHEVPHSAFHVDKGIFYTIKGLTTQPAQTIRDYIDGKRINHFPPLTYVILMASLYVFIKGLQLHFGFDEIKKGNEIISKFRLQLFLSLIPTYSFVYWLFYKKFGYNFWQIIVGQTYMTGHFILMLIIPNILFFGLPELRSELKDVALLLSFIYYIVVYYQLYKPFAKNKKMLFLRGLFCFFVATILAFALPICFMLFITNYLKI